jgi:hypothetical protein
MLPQLDTRQLEKLCDVFEILPPDKVLKISYYKKINRRGKAYIVAKIAQDDYYKASVLYLIKFFNQAIKTYDYAYLVKDAKKRAKGFLKDKKSFYAPDFEKILSKMQQKILPKMQQRFDSPLSPDDLLISIRRLHKDPMIIYPNEQVIFAVGSLSDDLLQEFSPITVGMMNLNSMQQEMYDLLALVNDVPPITAQRNKPALKPASLPDKALKILPGPVLTPEVANKIERIIFLIQEKHPNEAYIIGKTLQALIEKIDSPEKDNTPVMKKLSQVEEEKQAPEEVTGKSNQSWVKTTSQAKAKEMIQAEDVSSWSQ